MPRSETEGEHYGPLPTPQTDRIFLIRLLAVLLLLAFSGLTKAADIEWGAAKSGLKLGIAWPAREGNGSVDLFFNNLAREEQAAVLSLSGVNQMYVFQFWISDLESKQKERCALSGLASGYHLIPAGLLVSDLRVIPPNKMIQISVRLAYLYLIHEGPQTTLESLVQRGKRFQLWATYEAVGHTVGIVDRRTYPNVWTGSIVSGSITLQSPAH